jgi:hypothetical protein
MDMTRDGPDRTLPINPVRILRARQQVYSAPLALIGRLKHATFSIELGAGFATATLLPRTANVLPMMDLN